MIIYKNRPVICKTSLLLCENDIGCSQCDVFQTLLSPGMYGKYMNSVPYNAYGEILIDSTKPKQKEC